MKRNYNNILALVLLFFISCSKVQTISKTEQVSDEDFTDYDIHDHDTYSEDNLTEGLDDEWSETVDEDNDFSDSDINDDSCSDADILKSDIVQEWNKIWGSAKGDSGYSIVADSENNVFVGAATYGTFDMNEDILLLKVNSRGEVRWSRQTGSDLEDNIGSVVVDSEDNIYMAGYTKGTVNGEPNFGKTDAFLIKWNQEGEKLWAKQWGSDLYERANFVAVDKDDNLYVTGGTDGSMENYHNSSEGFFDIFISKFNSDGDMEWTKQWGTGPHDLADSIVVDSLNDKIYITGSTEGPLDGNMKLGSNDVFLTKLDLDGNKEWTRQWGSDDTDMGVSVKVSQSGKVFVLSNTDGDVFEENEDLLPSDQIALTKFTSDGDYEWTKLWGGGFNSFALDMVIDSDDKIFVTGSVAGEFEGFVNEKYPDAFITKWDTEGNIMWNEQWGNDYTNIGSGIAIDSIRNIYVTGRIEGPFSGVKENDWMDIFLAKFIQEN